MNPKMLYFGAGLVTGIVIGTALSIGAIRAKKIMSLNKIDDDIKDLLKTRQDIYTSIDEANEGLGYMKKVHEDRVNEYEEEIQKYEEFVEDAKANAELEADVATLMDTPENRMRDMLNITQKFDENGHFIIDWGHPEVDGPLTDGEQENYDKVAGDPREEYDVICMIAEDRYDRAVADHSVTRYMITEEENKNALPFYDNVNLTYYDGDDILVEGTQIVPDIEYLIDPRVLINFFKKGNDGTVICRNEDLKIDYIINFNPGFYQNVLGIPEGSEYTPEKHMKNRAEELDKQANEK